MATQIEYRTCAFDVECKADGDKGVIEGYASVFGNKDSYDDVIAPGAFTKTLSDRKSGDPVPVLWQHQSDNPIGVTVSADEDKKGLRVTGQLTLGVKQADEAFLLMQAKALRGFSIGFQSVKDELNRETNIRTLKEIKLFEWSPVTFPANELAGVTSVKQISADDIDEYIRTIEKHTDLSPEQLKDAGDRLLALAQREPGQSTHEDEPHEQKEEPPIGYSFSEMMQILKTEGAI